MAEGGGPVAGRSSGFNRLSEFKNNANVQRAIGIGMRVVGAYLVYKGVRQIVRRRVPSGGALTLGGLQLLSGRIPTVGPPVITAALSRLRA